MQLLEQVTTALAPGLMHIIVKRRLSRALDNGGTPAVAKSLDQQPGGKRSLGIYAQALGHLFVTRSDLNTSIAESFGPKLWMREFARSVRTGESPSLSITAIRESLLSPNTESEIVHRLLYVVRTMARDSDAGPLTVAEYEPLLRPVLARLADGTPKVDDAAAGALMSFGGSYRQDELLLAVLRLVSREETLQRSSILAHVFSVVSQVKKDLTDTAVEEFTKGLFAAASMGEESALQSVAAFLLCPVKTLRTAASDILRNSQQPWRSGPSVGFICDMLLQRLENRDYRGESRGLRDCEDTLASLAIVGGNRVLEALIRKFFDPACYRDDRQAIARTLDSCSAKWREGDAGRLLHEMAMPRVASDAGMDALSVLGSRDDQATEVLGNLLVERYGPQSVGRAFTGNDVDFVDRVIRALATVGTPLALAPILSACKLGQAHGNGWQFSASLEKTLETIDPNWRRSTAAKSLIASVSTGSSEMPVAKTAEFLRYIGTDEACDALAGVCARASGDARAVAFKALAGMPQDSALAAVIRSVEDSNPTIRSAAISELGRRSEKGPVHPDTYRCLQTALLDTESAVKAAALSVLARWHELPPEPIMSAVVALLNCGNAELAAGASRVLARQRDIRALPVLVATLEKIRPDTEREQRVPASHTTERVACDIRHERCPDEVTLIADVLETWQEQGGAEPDYALLKKLLRLSPVYCTEVGRRISKGIEEEYSMYEVTDSVSPAWCRMHEAVHKALALYSDRK